MPRFKFLNVSFYFIVEYDIPIFEKFGKGGTYPRRYHISYHQQDYNDGKCEYCKSATLVISFSLLRSEEENLDCKILMMENIEETESSTSFPKLTF